MDDGSRTRGVRIFPGSKKVTGTRDETVENREATIARAPQSEKAIEKKLDSFQHHILKDAEKYFPHLVGNKWQYQGQILATHKKTNVTKPYVNVSLVIRTEVFKGDVLTVTVESNSGNRGQLTTYSQQDSSGIMIHGYQPAYKPFSKNLSLLFYSNPGNHTIFITAD